MAMAIWPVAVPWRPVMPVVIRGAGDGYMKTDFDKGPAQRRRNTSAGLGSAEIVLTRLTMPETAALLRWHFSVLGSGTLPFEAVDPTTGLLRIWAFASGIDVAMINNRLRRVSFTLDLYPGLV